MPSESPGESDQGPAPPPSNESARDVPRERGQLIDDLRDGEVPHWLRTSAAVGWRVLVLLAVAVAAVVAIARLQVVLVPLVLALFIAAALAPPAAWLMDRRLPPLLATWIVVLTALLVIGGLGWVLAPRFVDGFADVGAAMVEAYEDIRRWLVEGPVGLDPGVVEDAEAMIAERAAEFARTGVLSRASVLVEIITGFFLTLVVAFFYIKDGRAIRTWFLRRVPDSDRSRAERALHRGWYVLQRYLVGVIIVGAADAVLIGAGLLLIGVPHVLPLVVLTLFGAFFPIVGAFFAGTAATLIALAAGGVGDALLVAGLTIAVQQANGDIIEPLVYSRVVELHPLSILLALTAGAVLAGILGAFLAVPVLAVALGMRSAWREHPAEEDGAGT